MAREPEDLNELKGQFLASLNHEIRTPLSGILGMTDLLLETELSEEQKDYIGATRQCAESLLETLNATLEYSALSANHLTPEEAEFHLRETLEGAVAEFSSKAESKGLRLICHFDASLPNTVIGDALRLRQLLSHLAGNAIKFTRTGEVEVSAAACEQADATVLVTIRVRDTGIGIPADRLSTIFDSFRQLETGLSRRFPGIGLGLAVAQKLASLLRGTLTVESEVGRGSTFSIRLPLRLTETTQARPRILVVDDNSVARTIARHMLKRLAYHVECVSGGPAAIEAASRLKFDLILMDLQMPGMDGFETAARIRELPSYVETPIVALTANCSAEYRDLCVSRGMQGFLSKPVQSKELVRTVDRFVNLVGTAPVLAK